MRTAKLFVRQLIWPMYTFYKLLLRRKSYLHQTGWIESLRRGYPCSPDGTALPWMNFAIVKLLDQRLRSDMHLFEYGSGYSTRFYAARVKQVVSVEYNKEWIEILSPALPANTHLVHCLDDIDGNYCRTIAARNQTFEVVVIDGRDRVNCLKQSLACLSPAGVILLDDSSRERYADAFKIAADAGFRELSVEGLKPTHFGIDRTTIFYRDNNCLGI